jgi:cell division protein FtsB
MKSIGYKKSNNTWRNRIILLVLLIILVLIGLNLSKSLKKSSQINNEITGLQDEIQNLEKQNLELTELIEYFNSDAYIEERARVDLGLKKEGEKVVILPEISKVTDEDGQEAKQGDNLEKSNPRKWWDYFFNKK